MIFVQWLVWGIAAYFSLHYLFYLRKQSIAGNPIHVAMVSQLILILFAVILFPFEPWNKLHLLWVIPSCIIGGWIMGFIIISIPIIGFVWKIICSICSLIFFWGTNPEDNISF